MKNKMKAVWVSYTQLRWTLSSIKRNGNGLSIIMRPDAFTACFFKDREITGIEAERLLNFANTYKMNDIEIDFWNNIILMREDAEYLYHLKDNTICHRGWGEFDIWTDWERF